MRGGGDWCTVSSTRPSFQEFQCQCNVISGCFVGDFDFCPIKGGEYIRRIRFVMCHSPVSRSQMDSGPVRLMTIAHAFNYRVAVLRDGVRSALRVGRSRKAEKCFLTNGNIPWGQQVAVMFQIVSTLMEEVPAFALRMMEIRGEQPRMQFVNDPWGHHEVIMRGM